MKSCKTCEHAVLAYNWKLGEHFRFIMCWLTNKAVIEPCCKYERCDGCDEVEE